MFILIYYIHNFSNEYEKKIVKLLAALFTQMNKLFNDNDDN